MEESITNEQPKLKESKKWLTFLIPGIICFAIGIALILISALRPADEINSLTFPKIPSKDSDKEIVYSSLTGEELADASLKTAMAPTAPAPKLV